MQLTTAVHERSSRFPHAERHGLASQISDAAVRAPASVVEGCGRHCRGDRVGRRLIANGALNGGLKKPKTSPIGTGKQGFVAREASQPAWNLMREAGRLLLPLARSLEG